MNVFDKICAVSALLLGIVLFVLGLFGAIVGCNAHFTLPPVTGVIPAFVGWGIIRAITLSWNKRKNEERPQGGFPVQLISSDEDPEISKLNNTGDK